MWLLKSELTLTCFSLLLLNVICADFGDDKNLKRFTGTIESFQNKPVDLVFLLDESGSIGAEVFPHEILFTELLARLITISPSGTRAAVVTFSTGYVERFNYIQSSAGNNMCTFVLDIAKVDYKGGGTDTAGALIVAGRLLQNGRSNAEKVIVLISDGQSNDNRATVANAISLKQRNIKIFAVGVASVNEQELLSVATGVEYIYILKNFEYIKEVNERFKLDTVEKSWDYINNSSLCDSYCISRKDCCDSNAACRCGTRGGKYECVCNPGFFGSGYSMECQLCPKGTYSASSTKLQCISCPEHSTTLHERSTSKAECFCLQGYEGNPANDIPCEAIQCAKLLSPEGGAILPNQCENTFNSTCTFKCHKGYCPYACNNTKTNNVSPWMMLPKEPRKCLENKKWSGVEFYCEKIKCPSLNYPKFGSHNCSGSDFGFGTVCSMQCDKGFILHGSEVRQCKISGEWDGEETICKAVTCPPLKENKLLIVKPKSCHKIESVFNTVCQYNCKNGYKLVSVTGVTEDETIGIRKCLADGKWSRTTDITCRDNSPPSLQCPRDIQVQTDKYKPTAELVWQLPHAEDNVKVYELKILYPPKLYKPPYKFHIGTTKVTYVATDHSGLNATCSFQVTVKDTETPRVQYCPENIVKYHGKREGLSVTWKEPVFVDNSGKTELKIQTRKSGDTFYWGKPAPLLYVASDPSGNNASCSFDVTVKQYSCEYASPPENGALTCDTWLQGALCKPHCEKGFEFVTKPEDGYMCYQQGDSSKWGRLPGSGRRNKPFKFPWPDCGRKILPKRYKRKLKFSYYSGNCPSEMASLEMKENFIKFLESKYGHIEGFCPKEKCTLENVVVKCGKRTEEGIRKKRDITSGRKVNEWQQHFLPSVYFSEYRKTKEESRQYRIKRDEQDTFVLEISFDLPVPKNESCEECENQYDYDLDNVLKELQTSSAEELSRYVPELTPIYDNTTFELIPDCDVGQVAQDMNCVSCPLGTFFSKDFPECVPCPVGKYQDNEESTFCKVCPSGHSTLSEKSRSIEDCKRFCPPGSYSETGMESCQACPIGTYQHLPAQENCHRCSEGSTTWTIGSTSLSDCTTICPSGTYSGTGFHPCKPCYFGTFQPSTGGKECISCPDGLTTRIEGAHSPEYCQVVDFCQEFTPCMNGGSCTNIENAYKCSCLDGFEGKHCEFNVDDCSDDFCLNNGTCIDEVNGYHCACVTGFTGQICETNIDDCHSDSCMHGGTCVDGINKFVCKCPNGFTGEKCEINYYDCASDPCQNGGTCFDQAGGFRCCCRQGYTGIFCEEEIRECDSVNCYNGGTCINKLGGFECMCIEGFEGRYCRKNIDDCQVNSCKNNGICIDGLSNYTCQCPSGYTGYHCEVEMTTKFGIKFPQAVTSDYVKLWNKKALAALTVSFWMRTSYSDKANRGTPISYSFWNPVTRREVPNGLTLLDVNKFVLYLHGKEFYTDIIANSDQNWHHCVITWESLSGNFVLYWDGVVRSRGSGVAVGDRLWSGYFVLGQEQDGIGIAFSMLESYQGEISQFNVWDHVLTSQSIQQLRTKCSLLGNVIAWTDVQNNLHGSVIQQENIDLCSGIEDCTEEDCYCYYASKPGSKNCWRAIPSCEPNPCARGQECVVRFDNTSECKCRPGFEGIFCQYDINECMENNGNCSHFCVNKNGSYECSCPVGMILSADKYNCIDTSYCDDNGLVYLNGETWTKKCEECRCDQGKINCTRKQCPNVECKENENEIFFPGECCSSCFGDYSSCTLHHETLHTFDNMEYSFSGNCRYSLVDDCFDGEFSVQYEDMEPQAKEKTMYLYVHCLEVRILAPGIVFINGDKVDVPYRSSSLVHIIPESRENSSTLFLYTAHGIIIKWEQLGRIEINVLPKYKERVCGLCGNFNGKKADDFQTKQHLPARTVKDLVLSWKVNGYKHCRNNSSNVPSNPIRVTHYDTCRTSPFHIQEKARRQCSLLKKMVFKPCYKHANPLPFYKLCLRDSCSCLFNEQCYCDSVMAYIAECERNGIRIKHEKITAHCAIECKGGTVFDECGPSCVETCGMTTCRNEVCVPGCHCPAGMALHNGVCIYKSKCPKVFLFNEVI